MHVLAGRPARVLGNHRHAFWGKKFRYGEGSVTWRFVMIEHPFIYNVWFHAKNSFSEPCKDVFIKNMVDSFYWRNKFFVDNSSSVKKISIDLIYDFKLSLSEESLQCHSSLCHFVSGSYSKIHDSFITLDSTIKKSCSLAILSRRSRQLLDNRLCSIVRFLGTVLAHIFGMCKYSIKIWWIYHSVQICSNLIVHLTLLILNDGLIS